MPQTAPKRRPSPPYTRDEWAIIADALYFYRRVTDGHSLLNHTDDPQLNDYRTSVWRLHYDTQHVLNPAECDADTRKASKPYPINDWLIIRSALKMLEAINAAHPCICGNTGPESTGYKDTTSRLAQEIAALVADMLHIEEEAITK